MKRFSYRRVGIAAGLVLVILLAVHYCSSSRKKQGPAVPVVVAVAKTANVPITLLGLGAVTPTYSITVKTQINGLMMQVLFKEGQLVKAGDLLAQIDPRPYEAQLIEYQGQLKRDQALLENANIDLKRYQTLWKQNSVAKQVLDTQVALVHQYEGTVQLDQGLIDTTKVNLIYCNIISPIDGRIGLRLVDPGNFVQTSDTTGIAVINMLNPMTVIFTIAEDNIPAVMKQVGAGKTLSVQAYNRDQTQLLATGTLLSVDNQVDPTTGTVKLRAQFDNQDNKLFPSQFVNVQLIVDTLQNAIIVPTAAIQYGVNNMVYVYVVNPDNTVTAKKVVPGVTQGDNTSVTGLAVGQSVVIEGSDKLIEGSLVTAVSDPPRSKTA